MKIFRIISSVSLALIICIGCGGKYRGPKPVMEYSSPDNWKKVSGKQFAFAFVNAREGMSIMVNATCDRYQKTPLKVLTRNLFIGMEDRVVLKKEPAMVGNFEAFHMVMLATLVDEKNGERIGRVKVSAYTVRAGECVYDVAYIATLDTFDDGLEEFRKFLDNFKPGQPMKEVRLH